VIATAIPGRMPPEVASVTVPLIVNVLGGVGVDIGVGVGVGAEVGEGAGVVATGVGVGASAGVEEPQAAMATTSAIANSRFT